MSIFTVLHDCFFDFFFCFKIVKNIQDFMSICTVLRDCLRPACGCVLRHFLPHRRRQSRALFRTLHNVETNHYWLVKCWWYHTTTTNRALKHCTPRFAPGWQNSLNGNIFFYFALNDHELLCIKLSSETATTTEGSGAIYVILIIC